MAVHCVHSAACNMAIIPDQCSICNPLLNKKEEKDKHNMHRPLAKAWLFTHETIKVIHIFWDVTGASRKPVPSDSVVVPHIFELFQFMLQKWPKHISSRMTTCILYGLQCYVLYKTHY